MLCLFCHSKKIWEEDQEKDVATCALEREGILEGEVGMNRCPYSPCAIGHLKNS